MRTLRLARTSALGTVALIAALSLTACQDGGAGAAGASDPKPAGSAPRKPAEDPAAPAGSISAAPVSDTGSIAGGSDSASGSSSGTSQGSASGTSQGSGAARPAAKKPRATGDSGPVSLACDGGNSKVSIAPVSRPLNHMLLTVTNTGSKACNAYYYPFLRFGEAQSVPQAVEASKPQAVVTLAPGESAYAGVMTSSADGSGTGGYSTKDLTVSFQGRAGSGSTGPSARVALGKSVYVDSTLAVTYWQTELDDALMY
ncbi:DUF4232 domain-containing protein [Streptomyces sp. NPDC005899]|uniref:DUF4232 domain-containing protein n=1 Tax=Streptomyces sp. NPDC005899 TaxID=3155716 RepID=UPI0033F229B2